MRMSQEKIGIFGKIRIIINNNRKFKKIDSSDTDLYFE